jgi:hypothetical protein
MEHCYPKPLVTYFRLSQESEIKFRGKVNKVVM